MRKQKKNARVRTKIITFDYGVYGRNPNNDLFHLCHSKWWTDFQFVASNFVCHFIEAHKRKKETKTVQYSCFVQTKMPLPEIYGAAYKIGWDKLIWPRKRWKFWHQFKTNERLRRTKKENRNSFRKCENIPLQYHCTFVTFKIDCLTR